MDEHPVFYREEDADPSALAGQTVAVVGYGNVGRSFALNLRDSGVAVVVGSRDGPSGTKAVDDGMRVERISAAVAAADVACLLVPDEVMGHVFDAEVAARLRPGAALCLASGCALGFGLIAPPEGTDVLLVAPRMLGHELRRCYLDGTGFVSYVSVERDATGSARPRLLALAGALGALRRGALELSAADEAALDLFIEQAIGPYIGAALQVAFQVAVDAGLPPEALVLDGYMSGEMARTFDTFAEQGLFRSVRGHGDCAAFGGFVRSMTLDRAAMAERFRDILEDIRRRRVRPTFRGGAGRRRPLAGGDPGHDAGRRPDERGRRPRPRRPRMSAGGRTLWRARCFIAAYRG